MSESRVLIQDEIRITQEIPLLKSEDRIQETLDRLNFNTSYFVAGRLKASEVYPTDFYKVSFDEESSVPYGVQFYLEPRDEESFSLRTENLKWKESVDNKVFKYGNPIVLDGWRFTIILLRNNGADPSNQHYFILNRKESLLRQYRSMLQLSWQRSNSQILDAKIESELPDKALDFLKTYIQVIIDKGLDEKNQQFTNTISFINSYLPQISDTINHYQKKINSLKIQNKYVFKGEETEIFEKIEDLEIEKTNLYLSNRYYDYLTDYIKEKRDDGIFAPVMIGLEAPPIGELMNIYTQARWLDKQVKSSGNENNPLVNKSGAEIERVERNIFESAKNLKEANNQTIKRINNEISNYYGTLQGFQAQSQEYAEIRRQVELYENVFYNLITRRTEVFLGQAATVSDYELISNPGYSKGNPISPNKTKIYLIAFFFGFGLPVGFIYLRQLMNNTVMSVKELGQQTSIPILGTVGHSLENDNLAVHHAPKSLVAESFRGIRASLEYLGKDSNIKVILITSSGSGEGKTFCSANLAFTYALSQKKVLLIGADMRKPTLSKSFGLIDQTGLSDYLAGLNTLEEAVHKSDHEFLDLIPGGSIPPNPAELLMSKRMVELDKWARKNYEYIIIDSPPVSLVADAFELMKYSNINLLIVRQGVTDKESFKFINDRQQKGQLHHLSILFNDVEFRKVDYGYKAYGPYSYGYGYYSEEHTRKPFWNRLFNKS